MKRILLLLCVCVFLIGCNKSDTHTPSYYDCPVCGEHTEYEPDPEDAAEWLIKEGYIVLREMIDVQELAWDFFLDDSGQLDDLINDYGIDRLQDKGWTLIPPGEDR